MPRFPRLVVPGLPHHVTQRGTQKRRTFFKSLDYLLYLELLKEFKEKAGLKLLAYCLMPNHIHAVGVPEEESSLARCFGPVHSRYAVKVNAEHGWQGHLWQQRFYSVVMDEPHTLAALRYVEMNPVRAGLCRDAADWRWSSARTHLAEQKNELIDSDDTIELVSDWARYLASDSPARFQDALRKNTRTGRPVGDKSFIDRLEALTGRQIHPRKSGPPKRG